MNVLSIEALINISIVHEIWGLQFEHNGKKRAAVTLQSIGDIHSHSGVFTKVIQFGWGRKFWPPWTVPKEPALIGDGCIWLHIMLLLLLLLFGAKSRPVGCPPSPAIAELSSCSSSPCRYPVVCAKACVWDSVVCSETPALLSTVVGAQLSVGVLWEDMAKKNLE